MTPSSQPPYRTIGTSIAIALSMGLFSLRLLLGPLLAMSAQSLAKSVNAALFALFGGSLLAFLQQIPVQDQFKAALGLVRCIVRYVNRRCLFGIYVNKHRLLSPKEYRVVSCSVKLLPRKVNIPPRQYDVEV